MRPDDAPDAPPPGLPGLPAAAAPAAPPAPRRHSGSDRGNASDDDLGELVLALIASRHSVPPKRLGAPGPDAAQLQQLVAAAATAPDHRGLGPWRLIQIADAQRAALADLFEACTRERLAEAAAARSPIGSSAGASADSGAGATGETADLDIARSREKAHRAPTLLLAVLQGEAIDGGVPPLEHALSLGAALMALMLAAHGQGFGAMLTSGRALRSPLFAAAFGLAAGEVPACFISIGTPAPGTRRRGTRRDPGSLLQPWAP